MRTSGNESDFFVMVVPLTVLVVAVVALTGGSKQVLMTVERHLWSAVSQVGTWLAALLS